jgi:hypothetical protein
MNNDTADLLSYECNVWIWNRDGLTIILVVLFNGKKDLN